MKKPSIILALLTSAVVTQAVTITPGFTFSVAEVGSGVGVHYHSNTGGSFGNPAGLSEVGGLSDDEEIRGLSEYDLTGLANSPTAFVTFEVYNDGGLFLQPPADFVINVYSYLGNNAEDISDFQAPVTGFVGSFSTASISVGDTISLDITGLYNTAIANTDPSFGIRLQRAVMSRENVAWTFNNFELTTDNQSTNPVPEGGATLLLGALGVAAMGAFRSAKK